MSVSTYTFIHGDILYNQHLSRDLFNVTNVEKICSDVIILTSRRIEKFH